MIVRNGSGAAAISSANSGHLQPLRRGYIAPDGLGHECKANPVFVGSGGQDLPKPHRIGPFARHGADQAPPNGVPADFHRSPVDRCEVFVLWSDAEPTFSVDLDADNAVFPHVPKVPVATDLDKVRFGSGAVLSSKPASGRDEGRQRVISRSGRSPDTL